MVIWENSKRGNHMNQVSEKELKKIAEYIASIQFGSVTVVIQNGKIIQIEKTEKIRMD
jgi:hypothetical protein